MGQVIDLFLNTNLGAVIFQTDETIRAPAGIFLWDEEKNYPVVSAQNQFRQLVFLQATPSSSIGAPGNVIGMISWDTNYIYVCIANHDGTTAIWKRVALAAGKPPRYRTS